MSTLNYPPDINSSMRRTKAIVTSSFVVEEVWRDEWCPIGIFVHCTLKDARRTLDHYRQKHPEKSYRIVQTDRVSQPSFVALLVEPDDEQTRGVS